MTLEKLKQFREKGNCQDIECIEDTCIMYMREKSMCEMKYYWNIPTSCLFLTKGSRAYTYVMQKLDNAIAKLKEQKEDEKTN